MKNITVSISEALALKLRVEAAKADKSLSRFLSETLERALFGASDESAAARIGAGAGEFEDVMSYAGIFQGAWGESAQAVDRTVAELRDAWER